MASKMKLPQDASKKLDQMSVNLNMRRNVICRIALGLSLGIEEPPEILETDSLGIEFNKPTVIGTDEAILTALVTQHFHKRINADEFFSTYVRAEIIRGLDIMVSDYSKINSPVEYMDYLCSQNGESMFE